LLGALQFDLFPTSTFFISLFSVSGSHFGLLCPFLCGLLAP